MNREQWIDAIDDYRSDDSTRKRQALDLMCREIRPLIEDIVRSQFPKEDFEEYTQQAYIIIIPLFDQYDPQKSSVSAFFSTRLFGGLLRYGSSKYGGLASYSSIERKISRYEREFEEKTGSKVIETSWMANIVGKAINELPATIDSFWKQRCALPVSFAEVPEIWRCYADDRSDPEHQLLVAEDRQKLNRAFENLSDSEQKVISYSFGIFGFPEIERRWLPECLRMPRDTVERLYASAIRQMRREFELNRPTRPTNKATLKSILALFDQ